MRNGFAFSGLEFLKWLNDVFGGTPNTTRETRVVPETDCTSPFHREKF
jgi:hypothetical protein